MNDFYTLRDDLYLHPLLKWFPSLRRIEEATLPSVAMLHDAALLAGFRILADERIVETVSLTARAYSEQIALRGTHALRKLTDHEFATGLSHMRTSDSDTTVLMPVHFCVYGRAGI